MKIITIRDEQAFRANAYPYYFLYVGVGVFFGVASVLGMQGYVYSSWLAFLFQLACSVWWYAYHLERKKLIEEATI